jgi:hypothetical protein
LETAFATGFSFRWLRVELDELRRRELLDDRLDVERLLVERSLLRARDPLELGLRRDPLRERVLPERLVLVWAICPPLLESPFPLAIPTGGAKRTGARRG